MNWLNMRNIVIPLLVIQALWAFGIFASLHVGLLDSIAGIKFATIFGIVDAGIAIALYRGVM